MSEKMKSATADLVEFLGGLNELKPRDAQVLLRTVAARHPGLPMELVWEEESYDGSLHYDVLVRGKDGTTLSVSLNNDGALPWPLRGVRRWSDADLAQVNGRILKIQEAVGFLDVLWNEAPVMERVVNVCLLRDELDQHPVELSDEELQSGMDLFRRAHKLHDAAETLRFMKERGLSHERLEQLVGDHLTVEHIRKRVTAGSVEKWFEAHRDELDLAQVARITFTDDADARRVHRHIVSHEIEFLEAAQRRFLAGSTAPIFASVRRRDGVDPAIFGAAAGAVLPPMREGESFVVTRVLAVTPAKLDDATRTLVEEILFAEWLAERRRAARVTWFWGTSDREV